MDYIKSFYTIPPRIQIILEPSKHKNTKYHNKHNKHIELPTYSINDIIKGKIIIHLNKNKNLEHQGIKIHIRIFHYDQHQHKTTTTRMMKMKIQQHIIIIIIIKHLTT